MPTTENKPHRAKRAALLEDLQAAGAARDTDIGPPINPDRLGPVHATQEYAIARRETDEARAERKQEAAAQAVAAEHVEVFHPHPEPAQPDGVCDGACESDWACESGPVGLGDRPSVVSGKHATVGEIFRRYGGRYLRDHGRELSPEQQRVLQELAVCRTPDLGYYHWECDTCGQSRRIYNPCRSRHCPQCLAHLSRTWAAARQAELLNLKYHHVVLTVPHEINVLMDAHRNHRPIYDLLFRATRDAVQYVTRHCSPLRATVGMQGVLHTWNQLIEQHLHMHIVMAAGGWSVDNPDRFVTTDDPDWIDKEVLARAFREALVNELKKARALGELVFRGRAADLADDEQFADWIDCLCQLDWFVIVKLPVASPESTLEYLAHYMDKVAIGNSRIQEIDLEAETVTFTYRNNQGTRHSWGEIQPRTLGVLKFIDRFLLHALPVRLARCRAYGFWAPRCKGKDLPKIRKLLGQPELPVDAPVDDPVDDPDGDQADQQADSEPDETFRQRLCAACGKKTMVIVDQVPKPTVYEMMQLKIWPEQFGYREDDLAEEDPQLVLPDVAPFLAGGDLFHEAMGFT